jgi:hypothetical protein
LQDREIAKTGAARCRFDPMLQPSLDPKHHPDLDDAKKQQKEQRRRDSKLDQSRATRISN